MKYLFELLIFVLWLVAGVAVFGFLGVIFIGLIDNYQNPITIFKVTKEVSILTEQKECEAKGGEFKIIDGREFFFMKKEDRFDYKLGCTKPITGGETIFSEEINLK